MARVTINDVARRAGVSKSSASFALNGRPGVSDATRARILSVARELDWQPHSAARALVHARADMVGLVFSRPARTLGVEPFYGQFISGLQDELREHQLGLQLAVTEAHTDEIATYRRWRQATKVDGVILVDLYDNDPRPAAVRDLGLPAVAVGGAEPLWEGVPVVTTDDYVATVRILDYLAALGHRRIAHVAGMGVFRHTRRRMAAVRDAKERLGLDWAESVTTDFSDAASASATRELLSRPHNLPTAIVYDSDLLAVAGLGVAHEMGVAVPGELSLVSFDDTVLTKAVHPAMTALRSDPFELGVLTARALVAVIADPSVTIHVASQPPRLVVRESTAAPRD
ncbi:HTH-type transcriptional regulator DegA [Austwickia sp. TVS 96-490-7B]|uniref:LacI family DNA-binding transcriptional regulator n=1 Tax=Austwickia sp. TVS 96-490-7B TaxID=2830843 RepID=UPI001C56EC75|nr:LacI family DNA-binding transcriptional regulator [Austwickia sp. TVS 96-490-7B]MBW3084842.1 HTH-type transcriptional regulator DegA [Austwickia sp. TVS 96-490-7B]